jgi:hypothetical protein
MMSTSGNIDRWRAFALLAVSYLMTIIDLTIVNVSLPIAQAPQYGWGATRTIVVVASSVALLAAFLMIESRVESRVLLLSIFRLRTLAGANVAGLLLGGSFFAFVFVGTLYMQQVLHYSALQAGVAWLAASLTSIAALAGVQEHRAGLASGLLNTSQQLGGRL